MPYHPLASWEQIMDYEAEEHLAYHYQENGLQDCHHCGGIFKKEELDNNGLCVDNCSKTEREPEETE